MEREFRGAWVATLNNIDWPSRPGLSVADQKKELQRILDRAVQLRLNALLFQVRPACDAFYESPFEPWSEYLTGQMGRPPAPWYDPLAFAIEEAHQRGLELHAWFNPFRARHVSATNAPSPKHISKMNPQIVRAYGKDLWLDPGEITARDYSLKVILDVVRRYDVDAIVMDDYFYPYKEKDRLGKWIDFPDWRSWTAYRDSGGKLARDDWRRENINKFVEQLYTAIKKEKRFVKMGLSPFGIWRPKNPPQIQGLDAFAALYADSRLWFREGWVDYLAPQLYWPMSAPNQSYAALLIWWSEQNSQNRHLWPAGSVSRVTSSNPPGEILHQIQFSRTQPGVKGNIHWSFTPLLRNTLGIGDALRRVYPGVALVPASPWLCDMPTNMPQCHLQDRYGGVYLSWQGDPSIRFWVVQTKKRGEWVTSILPETATRILLEGHPDIVAVTGVGKCGTTSSPEVFAKSTGGK
jgi:uncharacterized lipoprotein YddW (UPF0748 family)